MKKWGSRVVHPVRDMVNRMTPSQRISLVILAAVIMVAVGVMMFNTTADARMVPIAISGSQLPDLLAQQGVPYRQTQSGEILVPVSSVNQVRALAFQNGLDEKDTDLFHWLYDSISLGETAGHRANKLQDSRRRAVEQTLAWLEGIEEAKVHADIKKSPLFVTTPVVSTAAVVLKRRADLDSLPPRTVRSARKIVAGALGMPVSEVSVVDQTQTYDLDSPGLLAGETRRMSEHEWIRSISDLLMRVFAPNEYFVKVDVKVNIVEKSRLDEEYSKDTSVSLTERRVEEKQEGDRGGGAPGVKPNVGSGGLNELPNVRIEKSTFSRNEEDFENRFGKATTDRRFPSGEVEKLAFDIGISTPALLRTISEHKAAFGNQGYVPTEQDVEDELAKWSDIVRKFSTLNDEEVEANLFTFQPRKITPGAGIQGEWGDDPRTIASFFWLNWPKLLLALLALLGLFLLYRMARGVIPELEELPDPVADLDKFLQEKEQRLRAVAAAAASAPGLPGQGPWNISSNDQDAMDMLKSISDYANQRPDVVAAVLRNWMTPGTQPQNVNRP